MLSAKIAKAFKKAIETRREKYRLLANHARKANKKITSKGKLVTRFVSFDYIADQAYADMLLYWRDFMLDKIISFKILREIQRKHSWQIYGMESFFDYLVDCYEDKFADEIGQGLKRTTVFSDAETFLRDRRNARQQKRQ